MIESWERFKVTGPLGSEREGFVVYRIKDRMSGDYIRDAAGQIMHYSPLAGAREVAANFNARHERLSLSVFPERRERVSFE